jgi:hypothetical protein
MYTFFLIVGHYGQFLLHVCGLTAMQLQFTPKRDSCFLLGINYGWAPCFYYFCCWIRLLIPRHITVPINTLVMKMDTLGFQFLDVHILIELLLYLGITVTTSMASKSIFILPQLQQIDPNK